MTQVATPIANYFTKYDYAGKDKYICYKLLFKSTDSLYCTYGVMSALTLSSIHNVTMKVYPNFENNKYGFSMSDQWIKTQILYQQTVENGLQVGQYHIFTGLSCNTFHRTVFLYCTRQSMNQISSLSIWTDGPFSLSIRLFTITIIICKPKVYHKLSHIRINFTVLLLYCVSIFVGQSPSNRLHKRYIVFGVLSLCGGIICSLYGNCRTSLTSTVAPPKTYDYIETMLENDYKILFMDKKTDNDLGPSIRYSHFFQQFRLKQFSNASI